MHRDLLPYPTRRVRSHPRRLRPRFLVEFPLPEDDDLDAEEELLACGVEDKSQG